MSTGRARSSAGMLQSVPRLTIVSAWDHSVRPSCGALGGCGKRALRGQFAGAANRREACSANTSCAPLYEYDSNDEMLPVIKPKFGTFQAQDLLHYGAVP